MIAFQVYLNDVHEGGRTIFSDDVNITPEKGKMIMFPPLWLFPHAGEKPKSNAKYILGSYLHYLAESNPAVVQWREDNQPGFE